MAYLEIPHGPNQYLLAWTAGVLFHLLEEHEAEHFKEAVYILFGDCDSGTLRKELNE